MRREQFSGNIPEQFGYDLKNSGALPWTVQPFGAFREGPRYIIMPRRTINFREGEE